MLRGSSLVLFLCLCLLEVNAGSRVEWDAWEDDYECGIIPQTRIYEGTPAKPKDLPWMAVIYYKRGRDPHCGASVINRRFLLTAAHCVTGAIIKFSGEPSHARLGVNKLSVVSNSEDVYGFSKVIPHPEYDEKSVNRRADIGLLKVDRIIYFHNTVLPVCLPQWESQIGKKLIVAGWGKTPFAYFNDQKLKTKLRVLDPEMCNRAYAKSKLYLDDGQFCTGGSGNADTCRGDSGNGLYEKRHGIHYVQGIVSFGSSACGLEEWPSISTNVVYFSHWIHAHTST